MSKPEETALLMWVEGGEIRQRWPLSQPKLTIGRWADNDIVIDDRWVSRYHASICQDKEKHIIQDLDSKNGTKVNGEWISGPTVLHDGDTIQVTPMLTLTFVDYGATAPLPKETQLEQALLLDESSRQVWIRGSEVLPPLSQAQFTLLHLLHTKEGKAFSRNEIVEKVWAAENTEGVSDEAIDALVRRIRLRLRNFDPDHEYLVTVRGYGFKLDLP